MGVSTSRVSLLAVSLCALVATAGCGYSKPTTPPPSKDAGSGGGGGGGGDVVCLDNDGDGVPGTGDCSAVTPPDCDDANPNNFPGNTEACDEADNNCDSSADEGLPLLDHYADGDGDGFGAGMSVTSCLVDVPDLVNKAGDCNDTNQLIRPGAPEACNAVDDDCDGMIDDNIVFQDFYTDGDFDGFGAGAATSSCDVSVPGKVTKAGDCNDADVNVHPNGTESCNGKDDDCDGQTDEAFANKDAACQTGKLGPCAPGTFQCAAGQVTCVGTVSPSMELCDGIDNDCDGPIDESFSNKGQMCTVGVGVCAASGSFVCNASMTQTVCSAQAKAPTTAACDMLDNDCDGQVDETELVRWWPVSSQDINGMEIAPFFHTSTSCNGGQATAGTDAFVSYFSATIVNGAIYSQHLDGDGYGNGNPLSLSPTFNPNGLYGNAEVVQAGSGMAYAAIYNGSIIDVFYVGQGNVQRDVNLPMGTGTKLVTPYIAPSGSSVSSLRLVRGNGGRFVMLWREVTSGVGKIRMARYKFVQNGASWTLNTVDAPKDLITTAGPTLNFGAASTHEEFGDTVPCPQGLGRFAVAHVIGSATRSLKLDVFNEDGTATPTSFTVYSTSTSSLTIADPDVAWVNQSGDRWAVIHTLNNTSPANETLHFWQSAQAGNSTALGATWTGNGNASVGQVRIVSRPTEWLISSAFYTTSTLTQEPQIYLSKKGFTGTTLLAPTQVTKFAGCTGNNCTNGTRKVARAISNSSGTYKGAGAVVFGGSSSNVTSGVMGCN